MNNFSDELNAISGIAIFPNERIAPYTTLKVGGYAAYLLKVSTVVGLREVLKLLKKYKLNYIIIGNGSKTLFSNEYYDGIVIKWSPEFNQISVSDNIITVSASVSLISIASVAIEHCLSGIETIAAIPATVGGAIKMNAGAHKISMADLVETVTILDENLEIVELTNKDINFSYRHSIFFEKPNWVIISAKLKFIPSEQESIRRILQNSFQYRSIHQPIDKLNAGSIFKNKGDKSAWCYIDELNLRGLKIGSASISKKHANFIIVDKDGDADDVLSLIELVQTKVLNAYGIKLELEVLLINFNEEKKNYY